MKRGLVVISVVVGAALILQGCGLKQELVRDEPTPPPVKLIRAGKAEVITQPAKIVRDESPDKKREFIPEKREIIYDRSIIPAGDISKYPPLKPTQRRTMAQIRDYTAKSGLKLHFVEGPHLVRNRAPNGKWVIQRAQNVLYLGHWTQERSTGRRIFTPEEIAECGNPADGFREVVTPAKSFVTTTYRDREIVTVVERYRDLQTQECPPPYQCPSVLLTDTERETIFKYHWVGGGGDGGAAAAGSCGGGGSGGGR